MAENRPSPYLVLEKNFLRFIWPNGPTNRFLAGPMPAFFWGGVTFLGGGFNPSGGALKLGLTIQGRNIREPTSLACCWGGFFFLEIGECPNKNLGFLFPVRLPIRKLVGGVFTLGYGLRTPQINTKQKWKDEG